MSNKEFIQAGINRMYPGMWEEIPGGWGSAIEVDGQGILVLHPPTAPFIHFAGRVLSGLSFSSDLVRYIGKQNCRIAFGSLTLREGQPDYWSVGYGYKMAATWFDPASRGAPQLVMDLLSFIPEFINLRVDEMQPQFGGAREGIDKGWWYALMDTY